MAHWRRVWGSLRSGKLRTDIREEIELHRELKRGQGASEAELRREFGDAERVIEQTRDADLWVALESGWQDLRHAARQLRRARGFTLAVVITLALGIGANAAIFSLVNRVLLATLPVPAPHQLFALRANDGKQPFPLFSYPVFRQMEQIAGGRVAFGAASPPGVMPIHVPGAASGALRAQLVSGDFFNALGIAPVRGRWIRQDDNRSVGASPVAVLSYGFWQSHFGGQETALGMNINLRGVALQVVGIAPPGFNGLDPALPVDVWAPLMMQAPLHATGNRWSINGNDDQPWAPQEGELWLQLIARVKDPAALAGLAAQLSPPETASLHRLLPDEKLAYRVELTPYGQGGDQLRKTYGAPLRALQWLVALMLVIALANVATLLLARMVRRRQEIAVRLAIGISRGRLACQLLTEGLLLAAVAGAAAVAVADAASRAMTRLAHNPFQPDLDWRVWVVLFGAALATGVVLGLLPAWQAQHGNPSDALKSGGGSAGSRHSRVPLGRGLVIAQVAFSLLLVAAAGLFARSLAGMFHLSLGFNGTNLLTVQLSEPDSGIPLPQLRELQRQLQARVAALPGVQAVAFDQNGLDDYSTETSGISLAGRVDPPGGLRSTEDTVSRNFFDVAGMTVLRGRGFTAQDTATSPTVVVVNQAFVRQFYAGQVAIGKTFGSDAHHTQQTRIIGVVADARVQDLHTKAVPLFYRALEQSDHHALKLEVRTAGDPAALTATVRAAVTGFDPRLRVHTISAFAHRLDELLQRDQLVSQLSAIFGALALALACLGLFGVMSYSVAARGPEFGLRMALGAERASVLALVLREAAVLVGAGVIIGLLLALGAGRLLQPLLPGTAASDPLALAAAVALLLLLPLASTLPPAWRAARNDPARVLRAE